MRYTILEETVPYTGKELRSGWVRERTTHSGDAAAAFVGPCRVENEDLVDLDDARAGEYIHSESMAHIIIEHPGCPLAEAVLRQRLLVCMLCESLAGRGLTLRRDGDDVYHGDRKLTVSIAAPSASSSIIHLGINVRPEGAPVPAVGLEELDIDPVSLMRELLDGYQRELASCKHAEGKVRTVP